MSKVLPIQQVRALVAHTVDAIPHPTKDRHAMGLQKPRHGDEPLRYGSIVYIDGGSVAVLAGDDYLIARGDDYDDSLRQLAFVLRVSTLDLGVKVDVVDRDAFIQAVTG